MAFGGDGGGSRGSMSEINVTPLVDVMVVLLVVFMVTTPIIVEGVKREVDIDLPTTNADPVPASQLQTIFTLHADRHIGFAKGEDEAVLLEACPEFPACLDGFEEKLKAIPSLEDFRQGQRLFLLADRGLPYGFVVDVMSRLQKAGITNIGMVTNPPPKEGEAP